eukprot:scaffold21169_cov51-Attheya_sp.AAC.4
MRQRLNNNSQARAKASIGNSLSRKSAYNKGHNNGVSLRIILFGIATVFGCILVAFVAQGYSIFPSTNGDGMTPGVGGTRGASAQTPSKATTTKKYPHNFKEPPVYDENGMRYEVVFSTDCKPFQHWQSYLLFYHAAKNGQPGNITRIASGCSDEEAKKELEWHKTHISNKLSDRFHIHLTPHFSKVKDKDGKVTGDYKFFNKPFGLHHWFENGATVSKEMLTGGEGNNVVVILTDPDQNYLRPITADFSNETTTIVTGPFNQKQKFKVERGQPFAQVYGFGSGWTNLDVGKIAGVNSPALKVTQKEALRSYPVGPPYIGVVPDLYQISLKWSEFAPLVHVQMPDLMAEMYAYCIAAAHLELPHQLVEHMMVSEVDAGNEGWAFIDEIPIEDVCEIGYQIGEGTLPATETTSYILPNVIHFCQRYLIGPFMFGKHRVPLNFFECATPLILEPPRDSGTRYDFYVLPPQVVDKDKEPALTKYFSENHKQFRKTSKKRNVFMACTMTAAANAASTFFKDNHCEGVKETTYAKTVELARVI